MTIPLPPEHLPVSTDSPSASTARRRALLALLLLVPAPTIGVVVAMMWPVTQGTPFGKAVYGLSKVWILVVPLIWTLWVDRTGVQVSAPWKARGLGIGAALGITIASVVILAYLIIGTRWVDVTQMRQAAIKNGIGTPELFLGFAVLLSLVNSLLEEYVWRWFVFRQCEKLVGGLAAVVWSAVFFSLHHFFALIAQTPLTVALLGTLGVFIGGCAWSWCYRRFRSIWPGWVSHVIVDLAVFGVGYLILFGR